MRPYTLRRATFLRAAVVMASLVAAVSATAGIEPSPWRPASLVTANLVMSKGLPFVPLSDLARALGGTGRYDPVKNRYEIQPGPNGVLLVNPGMLSMLGPGGDPEHAAHGKLASQNAFRLGIGGQDVMIDDEEHLLLRPADPAISLKLLARLLGGQARFDPGTGAWVLPHGGPGSPLRFH
ncbi:MAG: hypothetical protein ABR961_06870 [Thermoanaerobaculaceae bacterium]|jgi:hypothetical protein